MDTLYIIGNGFDLYHKIDTYYSSFGLFLQEQHPEYYSKLTRYLYLPELDENNNESLKNHLWSEFEHSLTRLDLEQLLDEYKNYTASPADNGFTDGSWGAYAIEIEKEVNDLTKGLINQFSEFIAQIQYPESSSPNHLRLKHNAYFLSFNYTDTLERYYNINPDKIFYIHGKVASNNENIILGHGVTPESLLIKKYNAPEYLKYKEHQIWEMENLEEYDHSFMLGVKEVNQYVFKSFKPTVEIIERNADFFNNLNAVTTIFILGHSLSEVDMEYFKKIASSVNSDVVDWKVTYYDENKKEGMKKSIIDMGINGDRIELIKMESLRLFSQLSFF